MNENIYLIQDDTAGDINKMTTAEGLISFANEAHFVKNGNCEKVQSVKDAIEILKTDYFSVKELNLTEIAKKSGLMDFCDCFDNPTENELLFDTRIWTFDGYDVFDTLVWNKKGYNSFYKFVDRLGIEDDRFEAHLMYDVSGYNYWTLNMEESNYLFLTIKFKREADESELESIFDLIMEKIIYPLQTKWERLIDTEYYRRKVKV